MVGRKIWPASLVQLHYTQILLRLEDELYSLWLFSISFLESNRRLRAILNPLSATTPPPIATAIGAPNKAAIGPAWNPAIPLNPQQNVWKLSTLPLILSGITSWMRVDNPLSNATPHPNVKAKQKRDKIKSFEKAKTNDWFNQLKTKLEGMCVNFMPKSQDCGAPDIERGLNLTLQLFLEHQCRSVEYYAF